MEHKVAKKSLDSKLEYCLFLTDFFILGNIIYRFRRENQIFINNNLSLTKNTEENFNSHTAQAKNRFCMIY